MDNIVYQIIASDMKAYTADSVVCDEICKSIIDGGEIPKVRRMKRTQVPMRDLALIVGLKEEKYGN